MKTKSISGQPPFFTHISVLARGQQQIVYISEKEERWKK